MKTRSPQAACGSSSVRSKLRRFRCSSAQASFKTFDGLIINVEGFTVTGNGPGGDKHYIVLKPAFDEALARQFHVAATPPAPTSGSAAPGEKSAPTGPAAPGAKAESDVDATLLKGREETKALSAKVQGWAYEVPSYKYEGIFKPLEQLLKPKEQPNKKNSQKP